MLGALLLLLLPPAQAAPFDVYEKSIPELQQALESGETTSVELVRQYLRRIDAFDRAGPELRSVVHLSPQALEQAEALDRERASGTVRGPLHGIPILLKDNYDTFDHVTSAGSVALSGHVPEDDGYQVARLREAGAVFLGKTNMHELARGITTISSIGGQTRNPYDPRRNAGGSSGGTGAAIAASFAAVGMGSDTCGSIRIPSANNNLFGLRVTQGLSSRDGIVPLSHTQDVGGPLARSVIDLAIVLDQTVGPDPNDPQSAAAAGHVPSSYVDALDAGALSGVRLGLLEPYVSEEGPEEAVTELVIDAAEKMAERGATLVRVDLPELAELLEGSGVIGMEFRFDLRDYLAQSPRAPVKSLGEILERGLYHEALGGAHRRSMEQVEGSEGYRDALAKRDVVRDALLELLDAHELDALVYPTLRTKPARIGESQRGSTCAMSAHSGLPAMSMPAGFTEDGVPVGIELLARPFTESRLLGMAFAYERAFEPRRAPARTPPLVEPTMIALEIDSTGIAGELRLVRSTQTLHYELRLSGVLDTEIVDLKLHRAEDGAILELLGPERSGQVAVRNEHLDALLDGGLFVRVYTVRSPTGEFEGTIRRSTD